MIRKKSRLSNILLIHYITLQYITVKKLKLNLQQQFIEESIKVFEEQDIDFRKDLFPSPISIEAEE